jgi:hypothetical protein
MLRKILFVVAGTLVGTSQSIYGPTFFKLFPNYYFVETGTALGDSVREALKAGFSEIHSIEIDVSCVAKAIKLFAAHKQVHIWQGDSMLLLSQIIAPMNKPITFWLDAHSRPDLQADHKNMPILFELDQIKKHPIKTHTILIDDMCHFSTQAYDFVPVRQLIDKIKEINKDYRITFIDGTEKNDVLVAQVP